MQCLCGWLTGLHGSLSSCGEDMDEHLTAGKDEPTGTPEPGAGSGISK